MLNLVCMGPIHLKATPCHPPIPTKIRWQIIEVGYEPGRPIGYGATIQEAIDDFLVWFECKYDVAIEEIKYSWS